MQFYLYWLYPTYPIKKSIPTYFVPIFHAPVRCLWNLQFLIYSVQTHWKISMSTYFVPIFHAHITGLWNLQFLICVHEAELLILCLLNNIDCASLPTYIALLIYLYCAQYKLHLFPLNSNYLFCIKEQDTLHAHIRCLWKLWLLIYYVQKHWKISICTYLVPIFHAHNRSLWKLKFLIYSVQTHWKNINVHLFCAHIPCTH